MSDLGHHEYNYSNTDTGFFWYLISDSIIANNSNHKTKLNLHNQLKLKSAILKNFFFISW